MAPLLPTAGGTGSAASQSNRGEAMAWGLVAGAAAGLVVYFLAAASGAQTSLYSTVRPVTAMTTTTVPMMGRSLRVSASEGSSAGIAAQTQLAAHQVLPDWDSLPVSQGFGWSPMLLILLATAAAAVATFVWSVVKHNNHQEYIALAPHSSESLERRRKLLEKEAEYRRSMGHPGPDQVSAPTRSVRDREHVTLCNGVCSV